MIEALRNASQTLKVLKKTAVDVNVDEFVDDRFIKQAAQEYGLNYEARILDYAPVPFTGDALDTGRPITEAKLAGQIWVRGEAKVRLYSSPEATLQAAEQLKSEGKQLRVVFVHDRGSGIKLFADKVWYVHRDDKLAAFLLRESADAWAAQNGGQVLTYTGAQELFRKASQAGQGSPFPKPAR